MSIDREATPSPMFEKTFLDVTKASHAPGMIYSDPEILKREIELVFKREWLCMARAEELAKPGDYKTFRIVGEPVLLCRDEDGKIRAYANMCLHRGVEIATGEGNASEFTCPYHGWLYNLDGQLMGASYMRDAENFERRNCRLPELPVGEWGGWIFVSLSKTPTPFADHIKDFDEKFGYLKLEDMKVGLRVDADLQCNWKLMVENFVDFYHVGVLHKDSIGRFMKTVDLTYDLRPHGQVFVDEYDAGTLSKSGDATARRIPALEGKSPRFSSAGLLPPNLNFFVRPDYVSVYTSWPIDAGRMRMSGAILWTADTMDGPNRDRIVAEFKEMLDKVLAEDFAMVESLQNVTQTAHFVPGRMSRLERGVQHYVKHCIETLYGPQAVPAPVAEPADRAPASVT